MRPAAAPADPPPRPHHRRPGERRDLARPGMPPRAQRPAAPAGQTAGFEPGLDRLQRTSYRDHRGATSGTLRRALLSPARDPGRAVAFPDMLTVAPSTSTRPPHNATHSTTTPSVTPPRPHVVALRGAEQATAASSSPNPAATRSPSASSAAPAPNIADNSATPTANATPGAAPSTTPWS